MALKRKPENGDWLHVQPIKESVGADHPPPPADVLPKHEFSMLMIAPRGSGKTTLILNLITRIYKGFFHRIVVFSPTMAGDSKWEAAKKIKGVLAENKFDPEKAKKKGKQESNEEEDQPMEEEAESDSDSEEERHGGRGGHKKSLYQLAWNGLFAKVTAEPVPAVGGGGTAQDLWNQAQGSETKRVKSQANRKFTGKLKASDMFRDYDEDDLSRIMEETMTKIDKLRKKGWTKHKADRQLIVFDDLVGSTLFSAKKTNPFRRLNTTLRHYSTSIMMVSQGYKGEFSRMAAVPLFVSYLYFIEIPKTARVNATCVILFKIANEAELKSIYEENSCGLTEQEWRSAYDYCTKEPFSFMLINYGKPEKERIWRNFDEMIPIQPRHAGDAERKAHQYDAALHDEGVPTGEDTRSAVPKFSRAE